MTTAELRMFGAEGVELNGALHERFCSRPCLRLLIAVALRLGAPVPRRTLLKEVWPQGPVRLNLLSVTLYQLRGALDQLHPGLASSLEANRYGVWLKTDILAVHLVRSTPWETLELHAQPFLPTLEGFAPFREEVGRLTSRALYECIRAGDSPERARAITLALQAHAHLNEDAILALDQLQADRGAGEAGILAESIATHAGSLPLLDPYRRGQKRKGRVPRRLWYLVVPDTPVTEDQQEPFILLGARKGPGGDYWMSEAPDIALDLSQRILRERPLGRVYHTVALLPDSAPLPYSIQEEARSAPSSGSWCPNRAAWLYEDEASVGAPGAYRSLMPRES